MKIPFRFNARFSLITFPQTVFFIALFALLVRIAFDLFARQNYFFYYNPSADVTYYQQWANSIASGDLAAQKHYFGLPLYPAALAVLKRLLLGNPEALRLTHLFLGAINCALVAYLGRTLFSPAVGVLSGLLVAINFTLVHHDWLMMPVPLLITLGLVIAIGLAQGKPLARRQWLILGALLGIAINGDPKFIFFSVLVMLWLVKGRPFGSPLVRDMEPRTSTTRGQQPRHGLKPVASDVVKKGTVPGNGSPGAARYWRSNLLALVLGIALVVGLAGVRGRLIYGEWIFISPEGGLNLFIGNNPDATGIFENPDFIRPSHTGHDQDQAIVARQLAGKTLTPRETSDFWRTKAWEFVSRQPADFAGLIARKARWFFTDVESANEIDLLLQREWQKRSDLNPFFIICPLALAGWFFVRPRNPDTVIIDFLVLSQLIITLIFFHYTRHRASILPFLIIYEAAAVVWLIEQARLKQWRKIFPAVIFIFGMLILFPRQTVPDETVAFLEHSKKGAVLSKRGDFAAAQAECVAALRLNPGDGNSLYNLGTNYLLQGNIPPAKEYLERTLALNPLNADALFNLGYLYESVKQYPAALGAYAQVTKIQPESADAHFRMAGIYQATGDCKQMRRSLSEVLRLVPRLKSEVMRMMDECPLPGSEKGQ